jgi:hypothetical protein
MMNTRHCHHYFFQIRMRQHENLLCVQRALLQLWSTDSELDADVDLSQPMTYVDRGAIHQFIRNILNSDY